MGVLSYPLLLWSEADTGGDDATITVVGDIVGAEGVVARDEIGLTIPVMMKDAILV